MTDELGWVIGPWTTRGYCAMGGRVLCRDPYACLLLSWRQRHVILSGIDLTIDIRHAAYCYVSEA